MIRQGDVILIPVDSIPANAVELDARQGGKVILAYGEVTGHHHRFEAGSYATTLLRTDDGSTFLRVEPTITRLVLHAIDDTEARDVSVEDGRTVRLTAEQFASAQATLAAAATLEIPAVWYVPGAILWHEEHHGQVIPPGEYRLPGQRQYTSADMPPIRVAD
jgi:hypothetical protein